MAGPQKAKAAADAELEKELAELEAKQAEVDQALEDLPKLRDRVGALEKKASLLDPGFDAAIFKTEKVEKAAPTSGPQRLTFAVPFEATWMNLGAASWSELNEGISAKTDKDIFFYAKSPATKVELGARAGGYELTTDAVAWHFSDENHFILTDEGTLRLEASAAGTAAVVSHVGTAEVNGGDEVRIRADERIFIHGAVLTPEQPVLIAPWAKAAQSDTESDIRGALSTLISGVTAGLNAVAAYKGAFQIPLQMKIGKKPFDPSLGAYGSAVAGAISGLLPLTGNKSIHIRGTGNATASANKFAGLWGQLSSTVSGLLVSAILAPFADVTGYLHAGLFGGKTAAVSALGRVLLTSAKGPTVINSKTETHLAAGVDLAVGSPSGPVQLSSHTGRASIYAENLAGVLTDDFGIVAQSGTLWLGKRTGKEMFELAISTKNDLRISKSSVDVDIGDAGLHLFKNTAQFGVSGSGELKLRDDKFEIRSDGKKVAFK